MQGPSFLTNPALSLICFGGKGGVGKTTSAVSTALYLANEYPQKNILLASIDPAHSLIDSLKGTNDLKNLKVWEIDAYDSFMKFTGRYSATLKKIIKRGTFLDEADISDIFSISLPGIDELMGMAELVDLMESNAYDVIVLDTAPTGHMIKFLEIPHLLRRWIHVMELMMEKHRYLSKLYIRKYQPDDADEFIETFTKAAKKIERVLRDKSCEFVPVMLPEALSVNETWRFLFILRKYKIPVNNIIINRVYSSSDCNFCNGQYSIQKKYIEDMKRFFDGYNFLIIPLYKDEVHGKKSLLTFAQALTENIGIDRSAKSHSSHNITHNEIVCPTQNKDEQISYNNKLEMLSSIKNPFLMPESSLKFMVFSGKGGVGKTTLASATALTLSEIYPQKRILLFSTDPAHSLSDCLDVIVGDDGLSLKNNLYIQEMDADKEYVKLKQLYSEEIRDLLSTFVKRNSAINVVFEKEIMESLIDMTPPGIDEVMAITTIVDYIDKGNFDIFILDTAPTGHLVRFLETPELTLEWLKFFFNLFLKYTNTFRMPKLSVFLVDLSKKIKKLLTLLRDGGKSLFIPIAVLTEMAYEETKDLVAAVKKLNIPVTQMILNMVHPPPQIDANVSECSMCTSRIAYEIKILNAFKNLFPSESSYIIHKQENELVGVDALKLLGRKLYGI